MPKTRKTNESSGLQPAKVKEYVFTAAAVVMFTAAIGILLLLAWWTLPGGFQIAAPSIPLVALVASAMLSAVAGLLFLDASNPSAPDVILPKDRDFLSQSVAAGNEQAITQYLRLRNMRGVSGFFQKLGLPGLPLATIFLTILFTVLAVSVPDTTAHAALFDLAKLTLGAFIGSFVQRTIDPSVHTGGGAGGGQGAGGGAGGAGAGGGGAGGAGAGGAGAAGGGAPGGGAAGGAPGAPGGAAGGGGAGATAGNAAGAAGAGATGGGSTEAG